MFESLNSILSTAYFSLFALIAIGCGGLLLLSRHPLNGALSLVGVMLSLSGIYALLSSPFMAVLQVLVYAGAIMMLVVFVIMVLNQATDHQVPRFDGYSAIGALIPLALGLSLLHTLRQSAHVQDAGAVRGEVKPMAAQLFDLSANGPGYYLLFELIGVLLLVAVVAAVLLAKRSLDTETTPEPTANTDAAHKDDHHG
jgi:NADH-quinone oxidoreductase subunit J